MNKTTPIRWPLICLSLILLTGAPSRAIAAEVRFDVGLCDCRASYDAKRYGKASIDASVNLMTGHYSGAGLDTPWVDFEEQSSVYRVRFDGATREVKQADMPAELVRIKARLSVLVEQQLSILKQLPIIAELEPVRQIEAAALRSVSMANEAAFTYYATQDPAVLGGPLGSHALSPQCQSYAKLLAIKDIEALLATWTAQEQQRCAAAPEPQTCRANLANSLNRWKPRKNVRFDLVKFHWFNCALDELYREAGYTSLDDQKKAIMKKVFKNVRCTCDH